MEVKPGYKQTEVGVIPEDWGFVDAGSIGRFRGGNGFPIAYQGLSSGEYPFFKVSDMNNEGNETFMERANNYISEATRRRLGANAFPPQTIVFAKVGAAVFLERKKLLTKASCLDNNMAGYVISDVRADHRYIHYFLLSFRLGSLVSTTALPSLSGSVLSGIKLPLPPTKAEQEAIAEALSDADALIESLEQVLAKKRQLKQGAMQELLTGKKRLPGFRGEWEVRRLGEIGSTFGGLTGKAKHDFGHGAARYITFMNIMTNVVIECGTFEFVDIKPTESQNRVAKGDLFFNGSSETPEEVGMCAVLTQEVQDVFLNSFCFGFRFRDGAPTDGLYLAYFFRSREGRELLKSLAQGATRYNLSKTALLKVAFPLPQLPEQTAIATMLSDMDAEIAALEVKLTKARSIKQGMMQELLTGRIRLV